MKLDYLAGLLVLDHTVARDKIGMLESNLAAGGESEELFGRVLHEITAFDVYLPGERDHA